jgi:hypothetical protein
VAVKTAAKGMPVCERIDGFTTMIYDVARNDEIPAIISVEIFVLFFPSSKISLIAGIAFLFPEDNY